MALVYIISFLQMRDYFLSTNHVCLEKGPQFRELSLLKGDRAIPRTIKFIPSVDFPEPSHKDYSTVNYWMGVTGLRFHPDRSELAYSQRCFIEEIAYYFAGKTPTTIYLKGSELRAIVQGLLPRWRVVDFEEKLEISEEDRERYECERHWRWTPMAPSRFHHCTITKVMALRKQVLESRHLNLKNLKLKF